MYFLNNGGGVSVDRRYNFRSLILERGIRAGNAGRGYDMRKYLMMLQRYGALIGALC